MSRTNNTGQHRITITSQGDGEGEGARVFVSCSCGGWRPLSSLHYCLECRRLACELCCGLSVDTYYCPACLASVFSSQALLNDLKCDRCFSCPVCQSLLQIHSSGPLVSLVCEYCRWDSQNSQPPIVAHEATVIAAKVKEAENASVSALKGSMSRLSLSCKHRYGAASGALTDELRVATASGLGHGSATQGTTEINEFVKTQTDKESEAHQRHYRLPGEPLIPHIPAASSSPLLPGAHNVPLPSDAALPQRRCLATKLQYRCGQCAKFVLKPGPGAGKVAYEIQHAAVKYFIGVAAWQANAGKSKDGTINAQIVLKNPHEREVRVRIDVVRPVVADAPSPARRTPLNPAALEATAGPTENKQEGKDGAVRGRAKPRFKEPRPPASPVPSLPSCRYVLTGPFAITLAAYDDLADDSPPSNNNNNHTASAATGAGSIVWAHHNKACISLPLSLSDSAGRGLLLSLTVEASGRGGGVEENKQIAHITFADENNEIQ